MLYFSLKQINKNKLYVRLFNNVVDSVINKNIKCTFNKECLLKYETKDEHKIIDIIGCKNECGLNCLNKLNVISYKTYDNKRQKIYEKIYDTFESILLIISINVVINVTWYQIYKSYDSNKINKIDSTIVEL